MKRLFVIIASICSTLLMQAADGVMPIIAYMGVPNDQSTEQNFKTFSECGFTVSLYGYASLRQLTDACEVAHKFGVSILGHCPETHDTPERAAEVLKAQRGFFGYVLQDEPSAAEIRERQKEITRLRRVDPHHCFYINLHPYYDTWTLEHTRTKSYEEYVDAALATGCQQLSFDFYPVRKDGLNNRWYANLETIRDKTLTAGKPFWGFVLSVPHAVYPQPDLGALRLQVYSNLAYGAQAIQYFTYWTPQPDKTNDYHDGPVDHQGRKTKTYSLVQSMNRELKAVAPLFYGAKVTSVGHLGVIDKGTRKQATMPVNLRKLKIKGKGGAIVSQLEQGGHTYLALVNKNHQGKLKVSITARNDTPRHLTKMLQEEPMKTSYSVESGDILLFRLK